MKSSTSAAEAQSPQQSVLSEAQIRESLAHKPPAIHVEPLLPSAARPINPEGLRALIEKLFSAVNRVQLASDAFGDFDGMTAPQTRAGSVIFETGQELEAIQEALDEWCTIHLEGPAARAALNAQAVSEAAEAAIHPQFAAYLDDQQRRALGLEDLLRRLEGSYDEDNGALDIAIRIAADLKVALGDDSTRRELFAKASKGPGANDQQDRARELEDLLERIADSYEEDEGALDAVARMAAELNDALDNVSMRGALYEEQADTETA